MARTIAIIGALEKEVARIHDALADHTVTHEAGLEVAHGSLGDLDVVATVAGMGTVNAAAAAQHLISSYHPEAILFSGIAGGLNPALHIGDVVVGGRLRYLDTDTALVAESAPGLEEFDSSPALIEAAANALSAHGFIDAASSEADGTGAQFLLGTIATGDRFITGADKDTVVEATHADCVEMEGAAVAHVAAKNGTPCLVLRAISDNCDESYVDLSHRSFDLEEYARTASELVLSILRAL